MTLRPIFELFLWSLVNGTADAIHFPWGIDSYGFIVAKKIVSASQCHTNLAGDYAPDVNLSPARGHQPQAQVSLSKQMGHAILICKSLAEMQCWGGTKEKQDKSFCYSWSTGPPKSSKATLQQAGDGAHPLSLALTQGEPGTEAREATRQSICTCCCATSIIRQPWPPWDKTRLFNPSVVPILLMLTYPLTRNFGGFPLYSLPPLIPSLLAESSHEPYIFFKLTVHFGHLFAISQAEKLPRRQGTAAVALALSMQRLTHCFLRGVYGSQYFGRDFTQSLSR